MKSKIITILLLINALVAKSQGTFDSYGNITNTDFVNFVNLFEQKNLPISTDQLLTEENLRSLSIDPISDEAVSKFIKKDGNYITGSLYDLELEDDQPAHPVVGTFYPLYKLPTNGDYVLLVVAQVDNDFVGYDRVHVLSFDLAGNYLYYINRLYSATSTYLNNSIENDMKSVYRHVIYGDGTSFPPKSGQFTGEEACEINEILPNGTTQSLSFTKTSGTFIWDDTEGRFKRLN